MKTIPLDKEHKLLSLIDSIIDHLQGTERYRAIVNKLELIGKKNSEKWAIHQYLLYKSLNRPVRLKRQRWTSGGTVIFVDGDWIGDNNEVIDPLTDMFPENDWVIVY
jgi:hypothetical protein